MGLLGINLNLRPKKNGGLLTVGQKSLSPSFTKICLDYNNMSEGSAASTDTIKDQIGRRIDKELKILEGELLEEFADAVLPNTFHRK